MWFLKHNCYGRNEFGKHEEQEKTHFEVSKKKTQSESHLKPYDFLSVNFFLTICE